MRRMFIYSMLIAAIVMVFIPVYKIEPEFVPYQQKFFKEVYINCSNNKIKSYPKVFIMFDTLPKPEIGVCIYSNNTMKMIFDMEYWYTASDTQKLSLYFHEGLHCYLGITHNETDKTDIMYPEMIDLNEEEIYKSLINNLKKACGG